MNDRETTLAELKALVKKFKADRNWQKFHKPKNLSMSIAIEAAEMMEHYQWGDKEINEQEIKMELADIIFYCLSFADVLNIDISNEFEKKLEHNSKKYPVELFNKNRKGSIDYYRIKNEYRAKKK